MLGGFSLTNIFYSIDADILAYISLFLIFFALIHWLLKKTMFKDSPGILTVISASSALLAVYGLIRANFSIAGLMSNLNFPPMLQYNLVWIIFLLIFIILWVKKGLGICLMIIGLGLIIIGILKLVYADTEFIVTGIILFILGFIWHRWRKHRKKYKEMSLLDREKYKKERGDKIRIRRIKFGRRIGNLSSFKYRTGMRRGGKTKRRARFVGKDLANRYARRFGRRAAKKRFNQYKT
jgi:membrane protein implicated in regulation of membrane protease activity